MYRPSLPDAPTTQIRSSAGRPAPPWCCASCLVSRSAEPAALRIVSSVMHSDSDGFRLEVSRPTLTSPQGYPCPPPNAHRPTVPASFGAGGALGALGWVGDHGGA